MARFAEWHGSEAEILRLVQAVEHNCACSRGRQGEQRHTPCAAHEMLAFDQRSLDGLLFARWLAAQLQDEEWDQAIYARRSADRLVSVTRPAGQPLRRGHGEPDVSRLQSVLSKR